MRRFIVVFPELAWYKNLGAARNFFKEYPHMARSGYYEAPGGSPAEVFEYKRKAAIKAVDDGHFWMAKQLALWLAAHCDAPDAEAAAEPANDPRSWHAIADKAYLIEHAREALKHRDFVAACLYLDALVDWDARAYRKTLC